jgi:hypothetical protein
MNLCELHGEYPDIAEAIAVDGAVRLFDGRWSRGFVSEWQLKRAVERGLLVVEMRSDMRFAVLAKKEGAQ